MKSETPCPADVKNDASALPDGPTNQPAESPPSLEDVLVALVLEMRQQNALVGTLVGQFSVMVSQNAKLIELLEQDDGINDVPDTDMSGRPLRR